MSPATKSKSKSKDKPSSKATKEQQKALKASGSTNAVSGIPASAYNPISGTFHTLEITSVTSSPSLHNNGRFGHIDDTDDHSGSSHGTVNEYDSVSNNGSSGDLEDLREKIASTTLRQETIIPGSDNDKREKIRQKNERKHQRQRERRAQELHERCCGYIMSRKLDVLSEQLVAMGFSSERATLALIMNEGKVEQSISWLFDGAEDETQNKGTVEAGTNLKINITEELARIESMEIRYKCSKQEVEKALVASEGDLDKAEEAIKIQKQETPLTSPKSEEAVETSSLSRPLEKQATPSVIMQQQQRRNERDFNYLKPTAMAQGYAEPVNRNPLPLKTMQQLKPLVETRSWPVTGPSFSVSYPVTAPVQVAPQSSAKMETRNIQQPMVREPVIMMQRPQSINAKQNLILGTSPPPVTTGWYPSNNSNNNMGYEIMKSNGNLSYGHNFGPENLNTQRFYHQSDFKQQQQQQQQQQYQMMGSSVDLRAPQMGNSWNPKGALSSSSSSSLTAQSSLGLFPGWGSPGSLSSSPHMDWNTGGSFPQCDYNSIDWSLESRASPKSNGPSGTWRGISSLMQNSQGMRRNNNSMNGIHAHMSGSSQNWSQDVGVAAQDGNAGPREWTSPFAGQDIFSAPRQFVTSPSP